jgi:hypothetical protein
MSTQTQPHEGMKGSETLNTASQQESPLLAPATACMHACAMHYCVPSMHACACACTTHFFRPATAAIQPSTPLNHQLCCSSTVGTTTQQSTQPSPNQLPTLHATMSVLQTHPAAYTVAADETEEPLSMRLPPTGRPSVAAPASSTTLAAARSAGCTTAAATAAPSSGLAASCG